MDCEKRQMEFYDQPLDSCNFATKFCRISLLTRNSAPFRKMDCLTTQNVADAKSEQRVMVMENQEVENVMEKSWIFLAKFVGALS